MFRKTIYSLFLASTLMLSSCATNGGGLLGNNQHNRQCAWQRSRQRSWRHGQLGRRIAWWHIWQRTYRQHSHKFDKYGYRQRKTQPE